MRLFLLVAAVLAVLPSSAQNPTSTSNSRPAFPGTYAQLKPEQKKLIDEWYAEYDRMMHENDPPTDYDQLSPSTRTTFEAVTHALMTTNLTDESGKSMGNALDLVQSIETINGKIPKARGRLAVPRLRHPEAGCAWNPQEVERILPRPRQHRLPSRLSGELAAGRRRTVDPDFHGTRRTSRRH